MSDESREKYGHWRLESQSRWETIGSDVAVEDTIRGETKESGGGWHEYSVKRTRQQ